MKRFILAAGLAALLGGAVGTAWCADEGNNYLSGGVGDEDEARVLARQKDYNLKLLFTLNEGNYLAGVDVSIADSSGRNVIHTVSEGPYFMAKLPAGQYTVSATNDGKTITRKIQVGKGLRSEQMRWPSTVADFPGPRDGSGKQPDMG